MEEGDEVWLYDHEGAAAGYAVFKRLPDYGYGEDDWNLMFVWLASDLRRQGCLRTVWGEWREIYGAFALFEPNAGMEVAAFKLDTDAQTDSGADKPAV
jgi:hypothetical protein